MTTATMFTSMADFLNRATPGDTYAEAQRPGSRSLTTHTFLRRLTARDTSHAQRGDGGEVETLTTEHCGKSELASQPQYAYRSYITTNQQYTDGVTVSVVIGHGLSTTGRTGTHSTDPAKRMSATGLRTRHHSAVTDLLGPHADQSNTDRPATP